MQNTRRNNATGSSAMPLISENFQDTSATDKNGAFSQDNYAPVSDPGSMQAYLYELPQQPQQQVSANVRAARTGRSVEQQEMGQRFDAPVTEAPFISPYAQGTYNPHSHPYASINSPYTQGSHNPHAFHGSAMIPTNLIQPSPYSQAPTMGMQQDPQYNPRRSFTASPFISSPHPQATQDQANVGVSDSYPPDHAAGSVGYQHPHQGLYQGWPRPDATQYQANYGVREGYPRNHAAGSFGYQHPHHGLHPEFAAPRMTNYTPQIQAGTEMSSAQIPSCTVGSAIPPQAGGRGYSTKAYTPHANSKGSFPSPYPTLRTQHPIWPRTGLASTQEVPCITADVRGGFQDSLSTPILPGADGYRGQGQSSAVVRQGLPQSQIAASQIDSAGKITLGVSKHASRLGRTLMDCSNEILCQIFKYVLILPGRIRLTRHSCLAFYDYHKALCGSKHPDDWIKRAGSTTCIDPFSEEPRTVHAPPSILELLLVNHRFHDNALSVFFGFNNFEFIILQDIHSFADHSPRRASMISKLTAEFESPRPRPAIRWSKEIAGYSSLKYLDLYIDCTDKDVKIHEPDGLLMAKGMKSDFLNIRGLEDVKLVGKDRIKIATGAFVIVDVNDPRAFGRQLRKTLKRAPGEKASK